MVLAEPLASAGAADGAEEGVGATLQRIFPGIILASGVVMGPVVVRAARRMPGRLLAEDPKAELGRLQEAVSRMQKELDQLIASSSQAGDESREVLEAYRLIAADPGWLRRAGEAIRSGLSAGAAVERVASEFRDRMRRVADPYLRERLADIEDLAGRLLANLNGDAPPSAVPEGAVLLARRLGPAELLAWRKRHPALIRGSLRFIGHWRELLAFERALNGERIFCAFNLGRRIRHERALPVVLGERLLAAPGASAQGRRLNRPRQHRPVAGVGRELVQERVLPAAADDVDHVEAPA